MTVFLLFTLVSNLFSLANIPQTTSTDTSASGENSYIISTDGNVTHATSRSTNRIDFSSNDAAETVNRAISTLPQCGGRIFITAGAYELLSTIVINKPCTVEGEGSGRSHPGQGLTQLIFGNATGIKITCAGVRISHLQLKGAGEDYAGCYGIHLDASVEALNQNMNVEDVMIADTYYAIYGTGAHDIWDLLLSDVYINYCNQGLRIDKKTGAVQLQTWHIIISHARSDAIYLTRVDAIILDSIYLVEPGGNGIVIASYCSYPLMIRNCQIDECHENGIVLDFENPSSLWLTITDTQVKAYKSSVYVRNAQDIIISSCHLAASQLGTSNQAIVYIQSAYRVQISNCLIKNLSNQTRNCVELDNSSYCHVTNCQIDHSIGEASDIDFAIKETGTQSSSNQVTNNICVGISEGPVFTYAQSSINEGNS